MSKAPDALKAFSDRLDRIGSYHARGMITLSEAMRSISMTIESAYNARGAGGADEEIEKLARRALRRLLSGR